MDAKYAFWGAVVAALIGVLGTYSFEWYKEEKVKKEEVKKLKKLEEESRAYISIDQVFMPPINTKTKSAFFVKIKNGSRVVAQDLDIKVNFGESIVHECEAQPLNILKQQADLENGVFEFKVASLKREEDLYIYCLISNPLFDSILVAGKNLAHSNKYTFEDYKNSLNGILSKNGVTFFEVVGYILALIFIGFFTLFTLSFLHKKLSPFV